MLKKGVIILLLLLIPSVISITVEETLKINDTVTVNGKNFHLERIGADYSSIVSVDGIKGIVPFRENSTKRINGAILLAENITYIDQIDSLVTLQITVDYVCGDKFCNETQGEDSLGCCTDCGCKENGYACAGNLCKINMCSVNADCDDNDECTQDKCSGSPKTCSYKKIPDCPKNLTLDEEKKNTSEEAKKVECKPNECIINETCHDNGSILGDKFCSNGTFLERKKQGQDCSNNYECLNNECVANKCKIPETSSTIIGTIAAIIALVFGLIIYKKYFTS